MRCGVFVAFILRAESFMMIAELTEMGFTLVGVKSN